MARVIEDFKNAKGLWAKSKNINGIQYNTISGSLWRDMNSRCLPNGSAQKHRPKYRGFSVSESFKDFQYFVSWHIGQIGYNLTGYQLDKDFLRGSNNQYSEYNCVLIPKELNVFLTLNKSNKGKCKSGVSFQKDISKFRAEINIDGVRKYLGVFLLEEDAFLAYKEAKENEAKRWAKRLQDGEYIVDQRVINNSLEWSLN